MLLRFLILAFCCCLNPGLFAQIQFERQTNLLLPTPNFSGVAIAVLDMNGDGKDDIVRMNRGYQMSVEYQTAPGTPFQHVIIGDVSNQSQWGICAGDLTNNGRPDILTGGDYDGIKVLIFNGTAFNIIQQPGPQTFVQCVNMADINHDGWLDAFVCHDDGAPRVFLNTGDGQGTLTYSSNAISFVTEPPSDNSGNYGSVWSDVNNDGDLDLYIAKCRQGVTDPNDGRRINQLFLNNGDGTYTQDLNNASGLRIGAQSWTADFGDIDNDGDFDCFVTNHDQTSQLLENDGAGHFTDITASSGLFNAIAGLPIQGVFRDFDNDGYVDILVAGTQHYLFRNNGNKTFSELSVLGTNQMESFALGDLNHDGFQDIYAGYAEIYTTPSNIPDEVWLNSGNGNHFFGMTLRGVQSNRSAIGAKVLLYSALGTQVREVRSGESYGIMNSTHIHFGMGNLTQIDSVVVQWPSGTVEVLLQPAVDQYIVLEEGKCTAPPAIISALGSTVFCSGDSVALTVPDVFTSYQWTTGDTATTIWANTAGVYAVTATTSDGCTTVSNYLAIVVDPSEIPTIGILGDTTFCFGDSVVLTASPASSYLWSNGAGTASITVSESGNYSVQTQGLCAAFESAPVHVVVRLADLPVPVTDTVAPNTAATLSATGEQLIWYDVSIGGVPVFTGAPFKTPPLLVSTTFWVANLQTFDQPNAFTGMQNHSGSNFAGMQTNGAIVFDCHTPFRLARVKVYTNRAGVRQIDLKSADGSVLQSVQANIPVGITVVPLNMDIPVGTNLELTTDVVINQQSLGTDGPQLRRSDQDVAYPYEIPGYVTIKTSTLGSERYYYFYDWEVDFYPDECLSERVPVTAVVDSTLSATTDAGTFDEIRILPNPAEDFFTLRWDNFYGGDLVLTVRNAQGTVVHTDHLSAPDGWLEMPVSVGKLPGGMYWLEVQTTRGAVQKKLVLR